jgi:hypothetical protein
MTEERLWYGIRLVAEAIFRRKVGLPLDMVEHVSA